jgi:hypothetical protein
MRLAALAYAALLACGGDTGVIAIELVSAPGSDVLERIERVTLTLDNPPAIAEASRDGDGALVLDLEVDAINTLGFLRLEAFDASNALIGVATSASIPISAIDGPLALYVAEPLSVGAAPVELDPPRAELAVASLPFGPAFAGGRDAAGAVTGDMVIYSVYDHEFLVGEDLPVFRAGATMMPGANERLFIFSGESAAGEPIADLLVFDTNIAPAGAYVTLDVLPELARGGASGARVGGEQFVILGDPPVQLSGITGESAVYTPAVTLDGTITTTSLSGTEAALVAGSGAGDTSAVLILDLALSQLDAPAALARSQHSAARLPNDDVLIIGGQDAGALVTSAVRLVSATAIFEVDNEVLATGRLEPAVAATDRHLVVAGGADETGAPIGDIEVFDAVTLEPVTTLPMLVPRTGATATALGNGQVLIAGGRDAAGEPIGVMEMFSPD